MTRSFFRQLKADNVRYLLISGQATVLYGASTFSEDLDIWLCPDEPNLQRFVKALQTLHARYYKLTPPLTTPYLLKGHGFHFTLPGEEGDLWYLDVMGKPPRVPGFEIAWRRSTRKKTPWGIIPVVGVPDLVELKKTQRMEDYAVISRLVLGFMGASKQKRSRRLARWAVQNTFSLSSLMELIQRHPWVVEYGDDGIAGIRSFGLRLAEGKRPGQALEQRIERAMLRRMTAFQAGDRRYWRQIVVELKRLRIPGGLMPEGREV